MRYYYCTNCGSAGDFGFDRQRSLVCQNCSYNAPLALTATEYKQEPSHKKIGSKAFETRKHWVASKYKTSYKSATD